MQYREAVAALSQARHWRKASLSQGENTCVEVTGEVPGWVGVRDSKLGDSSPVLAFGQAEFRAFLAGTAQP